MEALERRPNVGVWGWVMDGFAQLHAARAAGFGGAEPIRPEAMAAWLDIHCITDPDMRAEVYALFTVMDVTWLKEHAKKGR